MLKSIYAGVAGQGLIQLDRVPGCLGGGGGVVTSSRILTHNLS